jgi:hypothetical protein
MFKDASQALKWAYNTSSRPIIKMAAINNMRQGKSSGYPNALIDDLAAQDRHGQAALIIGLVNHLPHETSRQFIEAEFGRRLAAIEVYSLIERGCHALDVWPEKQEAVYRVIKGYFCGGLPVRAIRELFGCRNLRAVIMKHSIYDIMDRINDQSMAEISEVLERHGLIESNYVT